MAVCVLRLLFAASFVLVVLGNSVDTKLFSKIKHIEKILEFQGYEIFELKSTVKSQKGEIVRLHNVITKLQTLYTGRKLVNTGDDKVTNQSKEFLRKPKVSKGNHKTDLPVEDKARASRLLNANIPVQSSSVAFYVQLTIPEKNIGQHHPIVFDRIITNVGNCYNKHTGVFTASQNGIYAITFTLFPDRNSYFGVNIFKNSEIVSQIFTDHRGPSFCGTTPISVITLNTGDTVFVRTSSNYVVYGNIFADEHIRSSFAGWKIADI
ncbi:C1QL [Mytilus coruscus]|uniref:C1QL n=1 Tax=Mytilus coruscus TaxID=42192 RepID=A0A6J8EUL9_MYTCO|nr:C1QL [Mytilus coruscus]